MPSKIPAAYAAVIATLRAALPDVTVIDGPGASDIADNRYLMIGVSDSESDGFVEAITGHQKWAQLGGKFRDEEFAIHCSAVGWNGDGDQTQALADAFSLFDAAGNAIVSDPSLGGALLYAPGLTAFTIHFIQDANGAAAHLPFDIECRTRI
jgi:hypothetical protein